MGEEPGSKPEGASPEPPDRRGVFDDAMVFDDEFVRAASIHEPSARARMLAAQWVDEPPQTPPSWRGSVGFDAQVMTFAPRRRGPWRALRAWAQRHPTSVQILAVVVAAAATVGILALTR
jgi:hypothetical protein